MNFLRKMTVRKALLKVEPILLAATEMTDKSIQLNERKCEKRGTDGTHIFLRRLH